MAKQGLIVLLSTVAILAGSAPGRAWDIRDDDRFGFLFHGYGDDMNPPAATPARPYWHEDSAVPPAMRWHDRSIEIVDEYGFTVATSLPVPPVVIPEVGVVADSLPPPVPLRPLPRLVRRRAIHRTVARRDCPPGLPIAPAVLPVVPPPIIPSAPPIDQPRTNLE